MSAVGSPSGRDQTRHHPQGKTCHHWQLHRLTCDEYDQLRARAAGVCEICRTPESETGGKRLVVDHFEDRRMRLRFIRGMLCDRCNAVMSCVDGHKRWGANRRWEPAAREYEARSWHQPSAAQWAQIAKSRQGR